MNAVHQGSADRQPAVEVVKTRLQQEHQLRERERILRDVRDAPIREDEIRRTVERMDTVVREAYQQIDVFIQQMTALGYPTASLYTIKEPFTRRMLFIKWMSYRPKEVAGWTIGSGRVLLTDGRITDMVSYTPPTRWELELSPSPFWIETVDSLEEWIEALRHYPDQFSVM